MNSDTSLSYGSDPMSPTPFLSSSPIPMSRKRGRSGEEYEESPNYEMGNETIRHSSYAPNGATFATSSPTFSSNAAPFMTNTGTPSLTSSSKRVQKQKIHTEVHTKTVDLLLRSSKSLNYHDQYLKHLEEQEIQQRQQMEEESRRQKTIQQKPYW